MQKTSSKSCLCSGGPALCGGTTISITDTWPPVSSLRSRTLVRRFSTDGIGLSSFQVLGCERPLARSPARVSGAHAPAGWEEPDRVAEGILEQDLLAARPADDVVAER